METGNATLYEIIDKATDEVIPVAGLGSGDENEDGTMDFIVHKPDGSQVVFTNPEYQNDTYLVRQRGSKLSPDSSTVVREDLESVPFVPEGGAAEEVVSEETTA